MRIAVLQQDPAFLAHLEHPGDQRRGHYRTYASVLSVSNKTSPPTAFYYFSASRSLIVR